MTSISYNEFSFGLDLRRAKTVADANRLLVMRNAYVTPGKAIKKRPGLKRVAVLNPGTKGLFATAGKLGVFYGPGTISPSSPLVSAYKAPHYIDPTIGVSKVHYAGMFLGSVYASIEYQDGTIRHSYLKDPGAWTATTAKVATNYVRPTTANGFRYECTTPGDTGAAEPSWPVIPGNTVADGTVVWTCRAWDVRDANCPHGKAVIRAANKIFSDDGDTAAFSAANDPFDWTTASDAGFLPVGLQQDDDITVTAFGQFQEKLVVFFSSGAQIWTLDPDPAKCALYQRIMGVGTLHTRSSASFSTDSFFLASVGFRSITISSASMNMQDNDVGSPIDTLTNRNSSWDVISCFAAGLGQYWATRGNEAWVYSFSRSNKIAAWSYYDFPVSIDGICSLANTLYIRSGDVIYEVDPDTTNDDGVMIPVKVQMAYVDNKAPGILKQFIGLDVAVQGTCQFSVGFNVNDPSLVTVPITVSGDTRVDGLQPLEMTAVAVSPIFEHEADEEFQLDFLQLHYHELGSV